MASKSELRLVKGVELPWLLDIMPLVCVVPDLTNIKLNVNTLTPERAPVLAAIADIDVSVAENLISGIPYNSPSEFTGRTEMSTSSLTQQQKDEWFDVKTQYFILHVKTSYNSGIFKMSSVFKVDSDNKVSVIRREFGGKI
jgi:general secretion pathway protein K